ncbi:MAG: methionine gamma-lyase family protein [Oscillospiraceae bacterium]|nr:methionine gamma-lyase family protein [Oscillospiraceae bacterium]
MEIFDPKPVTVQGFEIEERILKAAARAEENSESAFREIDRTARFNGEKVLKAFINNKVSDACLKGSTGYGYGDIGRDTLDAVFAEAVGAEDALVRHSIASGTHALTAALFGVLRTGDKMVSLTGRPYDTLEEVIGLRGQGGGSLAEFGIEYDQVDLLPDGKPDVAEIFKKVKNAKVAYIQRSRGYSLRPSLTVSGIAEIVKAAKGANPDVIVMVDNCYGEFVEREEPLAAGADLIVGSLIKNPGGGIAPTGGYIAGRKDLVEKCSYRLTCPGVGREAGASLDQNKALYQGLFLAPETVANALKTAVFTTNIMNLFGFETFPAPDARRGDIITSVLMKNSENLIAFCKGVQKGSPIDSFVSPEPWDMPGYDSQVIMAAGTFNNGASIELSADAPLREPYAAYVQGGLTYATGRMGILCALQEMFEKGCLNMTSLRV